MGNCSFETPASEYDRQTVGIHCTYFCFIAKLCMFSLDIKLHWSISTYMGPLGKSGGWKVTLMLRFLSWRAASSRGGELGGPSALC